MCVCVCVCACACVRARVCVELAWRSGSVMPHDGPGFDFQWVRCIYRASRPSQGTVNRDAVSK